MPKVRDASVWYGSELTLRTEWVVRVSEAEIAEVERAVHKLEQSPLSLQRRSERGGNAGTADFELAAKVASMTGKDVPLSTLGPRLQRLLDEVLNGRGFVLIKGLPVERWTKRQAAIAFLIIGVHLGKLRMQNADGHLLGHVRDLGRSSDDPNTRIYQTRERQTHHTDSCDVVGLLCLKAAKSGGLSSLVSSTTIFNEIRRRRPDLLKVLVEPIETDRRGEVPEGSQPYFTIPVFNYHDGLVSAIYQRQYIESARRFPGVAPLTSQQIEALDLLDQLANDPKLNLMMELEPGDIQLVHNHTILHDRTAFDDYPEPERKRHLLRLWLAPPNARPLPEVYGERFGTITLGDRGGVVVPGARPTIPFDYFG
ncbi:MAG TPA: TauD/TfdA family dioxygenase [Pyrinomonadaceae bacterium]|nr:TauD/TfdA family dioxygenase [Pyrinomonadaceae bacterium]